MQGSIEQSPAAGSVTPRPTQIVLCADDYALSPGVSRGIRDLIAAGRLSATSCMAVSPFWRDEAARLAPLRDRAEVGLHLTLTDQVALGPMPHLAPRGRLPALGTLMRRAFTGGLDRGEIAAEIRRQFDAFAAVWGASPDFVDGHQHVHQLPVIRGAVLAAMAARGGRTWLRCCDEPMATILRRGVAPLRTLVIAGLGRGLRAAATRRGIRTNTGFRGVYDFAPLPPYGTLFERFLAGAPAGTVIMCHPGLVDDALRAADPLTGQRAAEYRYFLSDAHATAMARHHAVVAPLP